MGRGGNNSIVMPPQTQAYYYVYPSLHYFNRKVMNEDGESIENSQQICNGFGIKYLDNLLAETKTPQGNEGNLYDERGLFFYEPTALIGEDSTHKSRLSKAFLSHAFARRKW